MLGSDIAAALAELRSHAESNHADRCSIERKTGSTIDATTGQRIDTWAPLHTDVPCRIRVTATDQQVTTGGQQVTVLRAEIAVPVSVTGITTQHRIVPTISGDPTAVGVPFYVQAIQQGSQLVHRRLTVTTDQG